MSYAQFENSVEDESDTEKSGAADRARNIFDRAYKALKEQNLTEERVIILEARKQFEVENGTSDTVAEIEARMPVIVKKPRTLADGTMEEYLDYIFKDEGDADDQNAKNLKMLQMAQAWKKQQQASV